ncbi:enoyl-CoA hydratase/isomerase family protein [Bordetella holmesii]|uniref:Enoyl-CoA hydratase/isomerase family protein n=1 Tax=Bordetella holmesii CDC-H585-BH TaxID=1331206 RepID=A0A158M507_9BORD|nr:enoyl-CoA hydratase-related protein [Bordetella holmesii]AHV91313.1 enoyl-CoA hydratase/isomerase family protein [Bordetella holmesii ATCC 51541]AMD46390.1 enoyl-CoA hydratase [Bordetella holmesii H558]AOB35285.1 enoyl-CoA hydratase [Bordetella holmesii]AUL19271.1 enoyl-CoA hydratase [Bordetella holmesii]AUL22607.1 enoyl-CoA hydratase [Bordetella holmesii]
MGGSVAWCREGRVARVELAHPGRLNAITVAMWQGLRDVFVQIAADPQIHCVILRGADGNFAAGADIREFAHQRNDLPSVMNYHRGMLAPALAAIAQCPQPVVAQIEGVCVGGGLEIAAQCDIRIACCDARFGAPINRLGFPMAPDEMKGLLALLGPANTLAVLLEGRVFDAAEALRLGLLTRVAAPGCLNSTVQASVDHILAGAPDAARRNKRLVRRLQQGTPLSEAEYLDFFSYADSHDHREGVRAFLAGEQPIFNGD